MRKRTNYQLANSAYTAKLHLTRREYATKFRFVKGGEDRIAGGRIREITIELNGDEQLPKRNGNGLEGFIMAALSQY